MSYMREIGRLGEAFVAGYLKKKGFIIVRQNYYGRYGEIDIIAESREQLLFVEVKTRRENSLMAPADAVDADKERKIKATAREAFYKLKVDLPVRFDIAEVTYTEGENIQFSLNYIENALSSDFL